MHICAGVKALLSGSGFSFGDVRPFEVIFPLIHYGGSFFFLSSLISAHKVPGEGLSWVDVFGGSIWGAVLEDSEKRLCGF